MQSFDFQPGTRVLFGNNTIDKLGSVARDLAKTAALVVTDHGLLQTGFVDRAVESLLAASLSAIVYAEVDENPTTRHVEHGTEFARLNGPIDLIIGLGGGSPMDVAKAINFLLTNGGKMEDYWGFGKANHPMLPSIGIPTTAGTGSEAQSFALISQENSHRKMACGDPKARFKAVILDPILTLTAPRSVAAISGIDAITHSIETYVTRSRNPLSQMYSREAWRLLNTNYEIVLNEPQNLEARAAMLLGSHFAGMAIEHSMLGAAHACANPLTARYGTPHGIAVSLMLPAVIRMNSTVVGQHYAELLRIAEVPSSDGTALIEWFQTVKKQASLPSRLREIAVPESDLPQLALEAAEQWTGKHNPRPLSEHDFEQLYRETY